jgi:hypothetical protein
VNFAVNPLEACSSLVFVLERTPLIKLAPKRDAYKKLFPQFSELSAFAPLRENILFPGSDFSLAKALSG